MISNTSVLTKKDFQSTERYRLFQPRSIIFSLIMFACGGYLLYIFVPYLYRTFKGDYVLETVTLIEFVFFALLGIYFVFLGFYFERFVSNRSFKRSKNFLTRTYVFTDEGLDCNTNSSTVDQKNLFRYSCFTGFIHKDGRLIIHMEMNKQKFNLILHDDGYTEGSVEEAIAILLENNIKEQSK